MQRPRAPLLALRLHLLGWRGPHFLGVWQLHRLEWKEKLIAEIESRANRPPQPLLPAAEWPGLLLEAYAFHHFVATGTFEHDKEVSILCAGRVRLSRDYSAAAEFRRRCSRRTLRTQREGKPSLFPIIYSLALGRTKLECFSNMIPSRMTRRSARTGNLQPSSVPIIFSRIRLRPRLFRGNSIVPLEAFAHRSGPT